MPTIDQLVQFCGRLHPMILHLPIGVLAALIGVEAWALGRRRTVDAGVRGTLAWLAALSAAATAGAGWLLAREPGYAGDTIWWHRWLGVSLAGIVVLAAVAQHARVKGLYAVLLVAAAGLMLPAGHLGATITHGADFLWQPFEKKPAAVATAPTQTPPTTPPAKPPDMTVAGQPSGNGEAVVNVLFSREVLPIFINSCTSCHGEAKQRGGLRLDSWDAVLAGGKSGPVVMPGDAAGSTLMKLVRLPLDDKDHMPPSKKPQPSGTELSVIERWILQGCRVDK